MGGGPDDLHHTGKPRGLASPTLLVRRQGAAIESESAHSPLRLQLRLRTDAPAPGRGVFSPRGRQLSAGPLRRDPDASVRLESPPAWGSSASRRPGAFVHPRVDDLNGRVNSLRAERRGRDEAMARLERRLEKLGATVASATLQRHGPPLDTRLRT